MATSTSTQSNVKTDLAETKGPLLAESRNESELPKVKTPNVIKTSSPNLKVETRMAKAKSSGKSGSKIGVGNSKK